MTTATRHDGLRVATPADAEELARVHHASWQAAFRGLMPGDVLGALSVARFRRAWERALGEHPDRTWVCEAGGELRGLAVAGPSRDADDDPRRTGELHGLYVHPDHWNWGVGYRLCHRALEELRSRGYGEAMLWVLTGNGRARDFYARAGFTPTGQRRAYQRFGLALPEMRLAYRFP